MSYIDRVVSFFASSIVWCVDVGRVNERRRCGSSFFGRRFQITNNLVVIRFYRRLGSRRRRAWLISGHGNLSREYGIVKRAVCGSSPLGKHREVAVDSGAVAGWSGHRRQLGSLRPARGNVTLHLPWNIMHIWLL